MPPAVQALNKERELFNRTHQATSNNLFQLKNGMNVTVGIGYMNHRTESDKQTVTQYFQANADTTTIREKRVRSSSNSSFPPRYGWKRTKTPTT